MFGNIMVRLFMAHGANDTGPVIVPLGEEDCMLPNKRLPSVGAHDEGGRYVTAAPSPALIPVRCDTSAISAGAR